jgi:O-antigen ligase
MRRNDTKLLAKGAAGLAPMAMPVAVGLGIAVGALEFGAVPVVGLCVLLWLVPFFCRHSFLLLLLWLGIPLVLVLARAPFVSLVKLGPILILPSDIPYFFTIAYLTVAAITRPREIIRALKNDPFLTLFLLMVVTSVVLYTPSYGKMAIGEARKDYLYFLFPLLATLSIQTFSDLRRLMLSVCLLATSMSVFAYAVFLENPSIDRYALPIVGEGSLVALFAVFSILISHANGMLIVSKRVDAAMLTLLTSVIILARTRTVFLAGAAGVVLLFWLARHKGRFFVRAFVVSIFFLITISTALYTAPRLTEQFVSPLKGIIDPGSDQNASWRMEGWRQQMAVLSDSEVVFGRGLGSYFDWYHHTQEVTYSPHNAYVQILLKFGLLGLGVYCALILTFFRRAMRVRRRLPPGQARAYMEMSILNFGAAHAYMTGYGFSLIILVFYAVGVTTAGLVQKYASKPQDLTGVVPRPKILAA